MYGAQRGGVRHADHRGGVPCKLRAQRAPEHVPPQLADYAYA